MEHIWFWIIVGIIAGALAKQVVPGEGPGGILGDLIIGVVGAFLGGWLFTTFLGHSFSGWIGSTIVAFVGSIVLLLLARAITGKREAV
ncbi:MAG TPA: GlsB/YeaQ/YmgE family stress response membrane protein [Chthonomonadaceae bacterium]|nr:GlsB/YeaQ/YmgE family stress response membrane protein [Chthonomonadaceae bacterium]